MIIYGTNGALIGTAPLPAAACPACAAPGQLSISLFGRYAHVYWIPLFPYSKPTVVQCGHCQRAWAGKDIPTELHPPILAIKKQTRTPLWHWSGAGLVGIALAWGLVASTQNDRADKAYLVAPHAGDVYTVHSPGDSTKYSLLKVVSARGNTVEVAGNEFETADSNPLAELNAPEKYSKDTYSLTVLDLQIMHNNGQLTDVDRLGQ